MATPDERVRFGQRLRDLRLERGHSLEALASLLTEAGEETSGSNVGAWERGQYAPRVRSTIRVLEQVLEAPGELAPLLGVVSDETWVKSIEDRLAELEQSVVNLQRAIGHGGATRTKAQVLKMREADGPALAEFPAAADAGDPQAGVDETIRPTPAPEPTDDPAT